MSAAQVVISEFLAVNTAGLTDEDGDNTDWIELYNPGDEPISLGGWHLTDNADEANKWTLPAGVSLAPGGFLVVFASGKDRRDPSSPLHTNFRLDGDGEYLALVDAALADVQVFGNFPPQRANTSFGFETGLGGVDLDQPRFFAPPTPGDANVAGVAGFVAAPVFSQPHGIFEAAESFDLSLSSATSGATVYYTLDGTVPAPGTPSSLVFDPAVPLHVTATTIVRAAAYRHEYLPSEVATQTYLFLDDVLTQSPAGEAPAGWPAGTINGQVFNYGMDPDIVNSPIWGPQMKAALRAVPTVSLVTDLANLVDPTTGIYTHAAQHGQTWERPVSLEQINPDGTLGFQIDAGMRIRGGFSRAGQNPKHAFRLFFREEYGAEKLLFPLFGDEGVSEFDALDLRADQNDSWAYQASRELTAIHDKFARNTQRDMGHPYTRSSFVHLYLNGQYWGLFQWQERPEAGYAASYFGGEKEDYDVIKSTGSAGGYTTEATDGNLDAWRALWEAARAGVAETADYYRLMGLNPDGTRNPANPVLLDVDNLIDYMLIIFWTGDEDAPLSVPFGNNRSNNWFAIRNRNGEEGFKFFIHDSEQTLFSNHNISDLSANRVGPFVDANQDNFNFSNPQWIHQDLMASAEYRRRFADRVQKHFFNGGALSLEKIQARWSALAAEVQLAILGESARWGDSRRTVPFTKDDWQYAVDNVAQRFFPYRHAIVLDQLRGARWPDPAQGGQLVPAPLYSSVSPPVYSQHGGEVPLAYSLAITLPPNEVYDDTALLAQGSPARAFVPLDNILATTWTLPDYDDGGWIAGTAGAGYEANPSGANSVASLIGTDVRGQMFGRSPSLFVRQEFSVTGDENFDRLLLRMKFDDGFVAYLDGVEVARSGNTPRGTPPFNERAGTRSDPLARNFEDYDLTPAIPSLGPGRHVLAIHGLNDSPGSTNMLVLPELVGRRIATTSAEGSIYYTLDGSDPIRLDGTVADTAQLYSGPIPLLTAGVVKARTAYQGQTSALVEASFGVLLPLRITEIMYNPPAQSSEELARTPGGNVVYDHDEYEFIELHNGGALPLPLTGVRISDGVEVALGDGVLASGEYAVVVRNEQAFRNRYGPGPRILAEYGDSWRLDNGGESIALHDAAGHVIQQVAYDDRSPWPEAADGDGYSLVTVDPRGESGNPSDPAAWRTSFDPLGSPARRDSLVGDLSGDNRVGLVDLILLRNYKGTTSPTRDTGDLNGDGAVNNADLAVLVEHFGHSYAPAAPSSSGVAEQATFKLRSTRTAVDEALRSLPSSLPFSSSSLAASAPKLRLRASRASR
jgi:hypothetical protein